MNGFQWAVLTVMGLLVAKELLRVLGQGWSGILISRVLLWMLTALCVSHPANITTIANALGITRGADLVLYSVSLVLLGSCTYFYGRLQMMEREVTTIIRRIAIDEVLENYRKDTPSKVNADE